jgi:hypothetical protein
VATTGSNGAGGHLIYGLEFKNVSATPCVLRGYPSVTALEPGLPPASAKPGGFFDLDEIVPGDIAPGASTAAGVSNETNCDARYATPGTFPQRLYHQLRIDLPGGSKSVVVADAIEGFCGLWARRFGLPETGPIYAADPLTDLRATVILPKTASRVAALHYVVALENPTDHAISLAKCPGYVEWATGASEPDKETFALNCDTVSSISAHHSVRFEMRLRLAPHSAAGALYVGWEMAGPSGANARGTVNLV